MTSVLNSVLEKANYLPKFHRKPLDLIPKYRVYLEPMSKLTISGLAKSAGVNLQTIRYYERQELLTPVARTETGYRIYQQDTVRRLRFIRRAQELGFSLSEIKELLSLRLDAHTTSADIRERARAKLADVEQKIRHLQAIQTSLSRLIKSCRGCGPAADCPILENLDGEDFS